MSERFVSPSAMARNAALAAIVKATAILVEGAKELEGHDAHEARGPMLEALGCLLIASTELERAGAEVIP